MPEATGTAKTIDQLPTKSAILGTDYFPVDDGVQSYKTTWAELLKLTGGIKKIDTTANQITITLNDGTTTFTITTSDPGKQDKLTFDEAPTSNSKNPVTSGGIYLAIETVKATVSDNAKAIEANSSAIQGVKQSVTVLNGDKTTEGSVAYQVAQALAELIAGAPESLDTLKEIADWITSHASDAAAMNSQITRNTAAIAAETTRAKNAEAEIADAFNALGLYVDEDGDICQE